MEARNWAAVEPEEVLGFWFPDDQKRLGRDVIARFGRHPYRNDILGRISTPEGEAYIAVGDLPHVRSLAFLARAGGFS